MSIEELVTEINKQCKECHYNVNPKATLQEIEALKNIFFAALKHRLPEVYCQILSLSNGIYFNGLTIWPTHTYGNFRESLLEANENLHESFDDNLIYYGTMDEELYIYDTQDKQYKAIEFVGHAEWEIFPDAEAMMKFMLERAIA